MSNIETVSIDNLVVVEFNSKHLTPEISAWQTQVHVPNAESCSRQVWYGRKSDFVSFPKSVPGLTVREGKEAYAFLLKLKDGQESKKTCESHASDQFGICWRAFKKAHSEEARSYSRLIRALNKDTAFVRDKITSKHRPERHEHVARDLSGQARGESVLIIGDVNKSGDLSGFTKSLLQATESKQKGLREYMSITNPVYATLGQIMSEVGRMHRDDELRSKIGAIQFKTIATAFEQFDRVYVTTAMGEDPEADMQIIEAWNGRVRTNNTLSHLRGNPKCRGCSVEPWVSAELGGYFSPEDIREAMVSRRDGNKLVLAKADEIIDLCADYRAQGLSPKYEIVNNHPELLQLAETQPVLEAAVA